VSHRIYVPRRGDLVHMNFSPSAGHEIADRHYALVISPQTYNRKSRMCLVCAITSRVHGWPFEVALPAGHLPEKKGVGAVSSVIVADAVRQVDFREREMSYVGDAPKAVLENVVDKLLAVLDED